MSELVVETFRRGPFWNFSYLIGCAETREAFVIDPAWDVDAILGAAAADSLEISTILLTHSHSDHVNGVSELAERTRARVLAHSEESNGLRAAGISQFGTFSRAESLRLGRHELRLLPLPGHSEGSTAILVQGRAFTGDALHVGGPGRPGPYPGAVEQLWGSLQQLCALDPDTVIHPGHDEGPSQTSTMGAEIARVPALAAESPEALAEELERVTGRKHGV